MKKVILAAIFMLVAQAGMAQATDAMKADVKKFLQISGINGQLDAAKKQVLSMVPAEKQAEFTKEFDASLAPVIKFQEEYYLKEFTADDLKQMIKYYESPIGKKFVEKSAGLAQASMPVVQEWSQGLQGMVMKYMQ
ncbi:DUF2059 domain-containing protein [Flavobacterium sp. DG1-102-2]|uniref:DUF2059 domain-containing protein n=1 Tax=Flavobacterium sp. DG1-102-2 TaxID=3081663 RepID=UPI0029499CEE|nr:DUF2059 domain-containing protein [Flavobacterium sp. DG1-102-2]MDV6169155.1 DUF2059 domain-containing protein [Flavobacterium sp. DG1-102-2]